MPEFQYDSETVYSKTIEIEDIGQLCLEAQDDKGMFYYLIIRTMLGQSSCLIAGPVVPDIELLPAYTSITFQRIDFNEQKLSKLINNFLKPKNKGKNKIIEVSQVNMDYALNSCVDIIGYMHKFQDTSNY